MSSRHLVDPELLPALEVRAPFSFGSVDLPAIRVAFAKTYVFSREGPGSAVQSEVVMIDSDSGSSPIRVLAYKPVHLERGHPAILHIHGGGYVLGAPEMSDAVNRRLAEELRCAIYSVDYRLAPEAPFPAALDDCYSALLWLQANASELGHDPKRVGVKGESAGGGLASALALRVRDDHGPALAFQHLIYPMIDDRTCVSEHPHPYAGEFVWTSNSNRFGWASYTGGPPGRVDLPYYAAPARAPDLAGLPPTFIAVGSLDLFLEENMAYAARLSRAGVPIEFHVYPGAFHGFQREGETRIAQVANENSREALRRALFA